MKNLARLALVLAMGALGVGSGGVAVAGESEVAEKALPSGALRFVAVPPCRLADTRDPAFTGEFGPPSLVAAATRDFPVAGHCGVAATAQAVSLNVTVVNPDRPGFIGIWPGGDPQPSPLVSSLNYVTGQVVPNAVIAPLGSTGAMTVLTVGNTDLILDVNGYYDVLVPVESINGLSGALTLQAGPNVAVTPSGQTLTISAAGGGGGTITGVGAGGGLTGGGTTGNVSLAVASQGITSGMIASGAVGTSQINTSQVQARIGGVCPAESTIQTINPDGSVVCHVDTPPQAGFLVSTLDNTGYVGYYTSVAIGADGLGLISYYDDSNADLKVAHCDNSACSTATTATLDSTGEVGESTSITIGADGLGLISYFDLTNGDLKVAHCNDTACSGWTATTLDSTGDVGFFTSITIGADGFGLISY